MSSYARYAMPTSKQAVMQTYRVCKCVEDRKQQRSSALVKRQKYYRGVALCCLQSQILHLCFSTQTSNYKLNTFILQLAYKRAYQMGVTAYYSCLHEKHPYTHHMFSSFKCFIWRGNKMCTISACTLRPSAIPSTTTKSPNNGKVHYKHI